MYIDRLMFKERSMHGNRLESNNISNWVNIAALIITWVIWNLVIN